MMRKGILAVAALCVSIGTQAAYLTNDSALQASDLDDLQVSFANEIVSFSSTDDYYGVAQGKGWRLTLNEAAYFQPGSAGYDAKLDGGSFGYNDTTNGLLYGYWDLIIENFSATSITDLVLNGESAGIVFDPIGTNESLPNTRENGGVGHEFQTYPSQSADVDYEDGESFNDQLYYQMTLSSINFGGKNVFTFLVDTDSVNDIPEPGMLWLLMAGFAGLVLRKRTAK